MECRTFCIEIALHRRKYNASTVRNCDRRRVRRIGQQNYGCSPTVHLRPARER